MKKKLLLVAILFCTISNVKAQYNLFDNADVDADGWLWFDTQAKIDKYIGEGKAIQLNDASFEPFEETIANPDFIGAGTDGVLGGPNAKKGAIILPKSSSTMGLNGGGIILRLPSCTLLSVAFSCDEQIRPALKGAPGSAEFIDLGNIKSYPFNSLSGAGQKRWENIHTILNNSDFKIESATPVTAYILNGNSKHLFLQGIKVLTTRVNTSTGISNTNESKLEFANNILNANELSTISVYNLCGQVVATANDTSMNLNSLQKGVYIVKVKGSSNEKTIKVNIQ